jgi:hypothetical protein
MTQGRPFDRPMQFTEILDETLRWSRRHLKSILLPAAAPMAVLAGVLPLVQASWLRGLADTARPDPSMMLRTFAPFVAFVLVFMCVQFFTYVAMIAAACRAVSGGEASMGEAWRFALRPRVFGTLLLSGLAVFAGMMCCFLPGIYVALLFMMTLPVMFFESRFGTDALGRSRELATHNPSQRFAADPRVKIFVMGFVGYLVGYAISFVVQLPSMVIQQILTMRMMGSGEAADPLHVMAKMAWIQAPTQMLGAVVQMMMQLYISFGTALLYFDLKLRREGGDLEAAAAEMAALPPRSGGEPA